MRAGSIVALAVLIAGGCGEAVDTVPSDAGMAPAVAREHDTLAAAVKCTMGEGPPAMDCQGLEIVESSITLVSGSTAMGTVVSVVGFTDQLVSMSIMAGDGAISLTGPGCTPTLCDYSASPLALPHTAPVTCTSTDGLMHTAQLVAQGMQGAVDTDTALVTCLPNTGSPTITVSPPSLTSTMPVGMTSGSLPLMIANNGTAPLTFTLLFNGTEWASFNGCMSPAMCTVAMGTSMAIDVRHTPAAHGTVSTFVTIDSNAGMPTVSLEGTGTGGVLTVDDPPAFDIHFGTIARGQLATRTVSLTDTGNAGIMVNIGTPGAPFAVSTTLLDLTPGIPETFTASCQSATAMPLRTDSIPLTSTAYDANTGSITVHCEVANTQLQVIPSAFDFMEVRKGTAAPSIPVTITNPGPLPANLTYVRLGGATGGLTLSTFTTGTIAVGDSVTGTLALATDADRDVAGAQIEIGVDTEQLSYPITGKVVTPAAEVRPAQLDLGTACIGTAVAGPIMMVNTGSARLTMQRPTMDTTFTPMFQSPTSYPAALLAGSTATVAVSPAMQALGSVEGSMSWDVDAPGAPFTIPVHLEYIDIGTAVSPGRADFGRLDVKTTSTRTTITLQNCNSTPVTVTIDGVVAQRGTVNAWDLQPRFDQRTLAPHDTMTMTAAFAPPRSGKYHGRIKLDVDGEARFVDLIGEGIGAGSDHTSFYACSAGSSHSWLVALALALVLRRRRR